MFEMWRTELEGYAFDVLIDLGRGDAYPLQSHPWFIGIRIPMADRQEDGLPTPTEADRLDVVENRIREVTKQRDGLYVGRRTGGGNRDLLFYMPRRPSGLEERIRASIGTEILFISRDDSKWAGYEQLLPTERDWRRMEDQKVLNRLAEAGANSDLAHRLVHKVSTSGAKAAEALVKLFEKLDLEAVAVQGEARALEVHGVQVTVLDHEAINKVSWTLDRNAPKAKGKYLGWTAEPVHEGEPEPLDEEEVEMQRLIAAISAQAPKG
jgi:hypothetical protein